MYTLGIDLGNCSAKAVLYDSDLDRIAAQEIIVSMEECAVLADRVRNSVLSAGGLSGKTSIKWSAPVCGERRSLLRINMYRNRWQSLSERCGSFRTAEPFLLWERSTALPFNVMRMVCWINTR